MATKKTPAKDKAFVDENPEKDRVDDGDQNDAVANADQPTESPPETKAKNKPATKSQSNPEPKTESATTSETTSAKPAPKRDYIVVDEASGRELDIHEVKRLTKGNLDKHPLQFVTVPPIPGDGNKKPKFLDVGINGYTYRIKRGVSVQVPKPIADLIGKHQD